MLRQNVVARGRRPESCENRFAAFPNEVRTRSRFDKIRQDCTADPLTMNIYVTFLQSLPLSILCRNRVVDRVVAAMRISQLPSECILRVKFEGYSMGAANIVYSIRIVYMQLIRCDGIPIFRCSS